MLLHLYLPCYNSFRPFSYRLNLYRALSTFMHGTDAKFEAIRNEIIHFIDLYLENFAYFINEDGFERRNPAGKLICKCK